jgi:hypothetical protein
MNTGVRFVSHPNLLDGFRSRSSAWSERISPDRFMYLGHAVMPFLHVYLGLTDGS